MKQHSFKITFLIVLILLLVISTSKAQPIIGKTNVSAGTIEPYMVFTGGTPCGTPITWGISNPAKGTVISQSGTLAYIQWHCNGSVTITATRPKCVVSWGHDKPAVNGSLGVNITSTLPVADPIVGNDTVCEGSVTTYTTSAVPYASTYEWSVSGSYDSIVENGTSVQVYWSNVGSSQNEDVTVTPYAGVGCMGTSASFDVNIQSFTPINFTVSDSNVCGSDLGVIYTAAPFMADPNILSGEWIVPIGANIVSGAGTGSITVDFDPYAQSGDIVARAVYACGYGLSDTIAVSVTVLPFPPSQIQGPIAVCDPTTATYSITPIANADTYSWSISGGTVDSASTTNPEVSVTWNTPGTGVLTVTPINGCGSSPTSNSINVIVHPSTAIAVVDSVDFDDASLTALTTKYLEFNHCTTSNSCSNKIIDKANLFLTFNTGEDYNYGSNTFSTSVDVYYVGYGGLGYTGPVVVSDTITLSIDQNNPEQVYNLDFKDDYYQIQSFGIEIVSYSDDAVVEDDIQLTAHYEEEFLFNAQSSSPLVTDLVNTNLHPVNTKNQYQFSWTNSCENFSNYEIQLLRLFNNDSTNVSSQTNITTDIDWAEALTIETQSSDTSIVLTIAEGTGYYVWRVRPIGNYYPGGVGNDKNSGLWSNHGAYTQGTNGLSVSSGGSSYIFFYNQFNDTINWIYSRTFTEGNLHENVQVRIAENITFANGLQQVQQTQAHLSTSDKVLTTQTINDFSGRPALTSMPVPLDDEVSLGYKFEFMKNIGDSIYTAEDYDDDTNYKNPEPVKDASGTHFAYYSDNNGDVTIPSAEQFPFSRTLFYNDGNSRVFEQSGVSETFRIKSNLTESKTNKTFYSGVADDELIRVFGDEAPFRESVHKVINVDGNNTATVTYIGKDGKTLATCLAINGSNTLDDNSASLMGLESQATAIFTVNDTITNSTPYGDYGNQSTTSQTFVEQTTVNIYYDLTPKAVEDICLDYCATCDYYVEISVQDITQPDSAYLYHSKLLPSEICDSADFSAYEMDTSITLPPGTFIFTKRVVANNTVPNTISLADSIGSTYLELHLDSVRNLYDTLIYGVNGQLDTIRGYLDSANINGMYQYLGINVDTARADTVYQDSLVYITIGCDSLPIPIILCPQKLCPPDESFVDYFNEFWDGSYDFATISNGNRSWAQYSSYKFDTLVSNMISDGYSCDSLWDCWYSIVQSYEILNDSLYGDPNVPPGITFNIVDAFLDCAGRRIEGISTTDFGNPGYLSHAYAYFNYNGSNTTCEEYFVEQYPFTYPTASCEYPTFSCFVDSTWNEFYHCVTNVDPNPSSPVADTNAVTAAQAMTDTCEVYCEAKKAGFIDAIIEAYHQDQQYVGANPDTSVSATYLYSGDMYALEYDSVLNNYQFNDTVLLDPLTSKVNWSKIECMADALVRNCKEGCTLSPIFDSISGDTLLGIGSEEEQLAFEQSFVWAYEVALPAVNPYTGELECDSGWIHIDTGIDGVYGTTLVSDTLIHTIDSVCVNDSVSPPPCGSPAWLISEFIVVENTENINEVDFQIICTSIDTSYISYYMDYTYIDPGSIDSSYASSDTICETIYPCYQDICFRYVPFPIIPDSIPEILPITCEQSATLDILNAIEHQVYGYIEDKVQAFEDSYTNTCVNPDSINDNFYLSYPLGYHHYTLYYYNRAGSLIQTVPPQGVDLLDINNPNDPIDEFFTPASPLDRSKSPVHRFITDYEYNSLGQLVKQQTPDGDTTAFYYNNLGQLRFSQNAQQKEDTAYSYTKYDELGRIIEVGESKQAAINDDFTLASNIATDNFPADTSYNSEVTYTVYTEGAGVSYLNDAITEQRYLLNRVSYTYTDEDANLNTTDDQTYTYYSYDPHGNVEWLIQDIPGFLDKQYLRYEYDLVSGNVLKVCYNEGKTDQFYHRYTYDADNRITLAETSVNNIIWEKDAGYDYYIHGPLARTRIGEDKVQGMDYVYTIHGWLKALNHPSFDKTKDPGNDGTNVTNNFAKDVFAMQLGYFTGDFNRSSSPFNTNISNTVDNATLNPASNRDLYNGNISTWATNNVQHPSSSDPYPGLTGYQYRYDELNRIRIADFKENVSVGSNYTSALDQYSATYKYDANGNIYNLNRNGNPTNVDMDSLKYYYYDAAGGVYDETSTVPTLPTNKLAYVDDYVIGSSYNDDIEAQTSGNYTYDKIGNLIQDLGEDSIAEIKWTVYGKIKEINRVTGSTKPNLRFIYDASGNRIAKIVIPDSDDPSQNVVTWYSRDASGNVMAVYKSTYDSTASALKEDINLIEQPIYGSSRVGQRTENKLIKTAYYPVSGTPYDTINITNSIVTENTNMQIGVQKPPTSTINWSTNSYPTIYISPQSGAKQNIDFTNSGSPVNGTPNAQFSFSQQGENICTVEGDNGNIVFSAYTAKQYGFQGTNVCKVLDANNNIMPIPSLTNPIKSNWRGKSLGIRKPGTLNIYYLITVGTDKKAYYHEINTTTGQVTSVNNAIDGASGYGYGMALIEDQSPIASSMLYLRRFNGSDSASIITVPITMSGVGTPTVAATFSSKDANGKGEMQISTDGTKLAIANQKGSYAWLSNQGEIRVYDLDINHDVTTLNTNYNTSTFSSLNSIDFSPTSEHVYYNQQATLLSFPSTINNGQNVKKLNINTLYDTVVIANTNGNIRRGKDDNMYVALNTQSNLNKISNPDGSFSVSNYTFATLPWQTTQGIPLQAHKILELDENLITRTMGLKQYEINDHLGNVRAVVSDLKESTLIAGIPSDFEPDIVATSNYYPFGSLMPGRNMSTSAYRYGFNGKESDNEIKNVTGSSYDFGARMYDPRIGRFLSIDPLWKRYQFRSPYTFAANNPIRFVDKEGENPDDVIRLSLENLKKEQGYVVVFNLETDKTMIYRTTLTFNERSSVSENAVNYTITETGIELDSKGNIISVTTTETDVSAEVKQSKGFFGNISYNLVKNEVGNSNITEFADTEYGDKNILERERKGDLIVHQTRVLLDKNKNAKITGRDLPNLSAGDKLENFGDYLPTVSDLVKLIGIGTGRETPGADYLPSYDKPRNNTTTLVIPLDEKQDAANGLSKAANNKTKGGGKVKKL